MGGKLDVVKYLHTNGCSLNTETSKNAVEGGHFEVVKYLHSNGCPFGNDSMDGAVCGGNIEIMKYLLAEGFEMDGETADVAINSGRMRVIKFMIENGYNFDQDEIYAAIDLGYFNMAEYMIGHLKKTKLYYDNDGVGSDPEGDSFLLRAAEEGHTKMVKYFFDAGAKFPKNDIVQAIDNATENEHHEIVSYLQNKITMLSV